MPWPDFYTLTVVYVHAFTIFLLRSQFVSIIKVELSASG